MQFQSVYNRKVFILCNIILCILTIYYKFNQFPVTVDKNISCYDDSSDDDFSESIGNILNSEESKIFFLETSCKGGLSSRQACSVESAAKANPNWTIVVLFTGPIDPNYNKGKTLTALSSMSNIKFVRINVTTIFEETLLERFYTTGVLKYVSVDPIAHISQMLRLIILNMYGGVYLDSDVIVMKSFHNLPENFITKQSDDMAASDILAFASDGIGQKFTETALRIFSLHYDPKSWAEAGPFVVTLNLRFMCTMNMSILRQLNFCRGVYIFSPKYFYPVTYPDWLMYYKDTPSDDSEAFTHHTLWNHIGGNQKIGVDSLLGRLAQKYCPKVYGLYQKGATYILDDDF